MMGVFETKSAEIERLSLDLDLKFAAETGTVTGYGSVFGALDLGGDVVEPGAFKASLVDWKRKGGMPPMLWQHDQSQPIGVWTDISEDEKGLKVTGRLVMDVPKAMEARALMQAGALKGLSIGYRTIDAKVDRSTGARMLKKLDLWEISLVTFPMNPQATISGVKTFDPRALEAQFRALGLSGRDAVKAVAIVKNHLRDGGEPPEQEPRDGAKNLLMSLRKATESLR